MRSCCWNPWCSLFAQQLGTPVKVSEKRIRKLLASA
ncbi:DUF3418 domain-containing protein [Georgenia sp. 1P01AC]